jgi:hypothetical protein
VDAVVALVEVTDLDIRALESQLAGRPEGPAIDERAVIDPPGELIDAH